MASQNFLDKVTTIEAEWANEVDALVHDVFSGASSVSEARTALALVIGTDVQAYDATLQSLAALGTTADRMAYTTGVNTWTETVITAVGRSILDDATVGDVRATISAAESGANSDITALSGLTTALSIAQGGTGQTTAQAAMDTISQVSAATNEYVLTKDTATGNALWKIPVVPSYVDNAHLYLGTGNDIDIWHDATTSHIENNTGNVIYKNNAANTYTAFYQRSNADIESQVMRLHGTVANPYVELMWDDTSMLTTEVHGVTVRGLASFVKDEGTTGATLNINVNTGSYHFMVLGDNTAITINSLASWPSGVWYEMTLELKQDTTGTRVPSFTNTILWAGGTAPTFSTAINAVDIIRISSRDGGTTLYGEVIGLDMKQEIDNGT